MAFNSILATTILFFIYLVSIFSCQAGGSGRGISKKDRASPVAGLCSAASDALHGYKCQELEDGLTWLMNSAEQNLPTILADNGYDVWISNIRGTQFSRRHVSMDTLNPEYWNWTWDDLVEKDLHSVVDFVFTQTGQQVHYIGHSMGTLIALSAFSESNLVEKLKSAVLLSTIAYLSHMTSPIAIAAVRLFLGELLGKVIGFEEFDLRGITGSKFIKLLCANPPVDCYDLAAAFTGKNCCLNQSTVEMFLKNEPAPTSVKNLIHFSQIYRSGTVSKFDYRVSNIQHYGQLTPPIYDLTKVPQNFPLFLSYGGLDALSDVVDVQNLLCNDLRGHDQDKLKVQLVHEYAHVDFIMGYNVKDIVYNQVIDFFKQFS